MTNREISSHLADARFSLLLFVYFLFYIFYFIDIEGMRLARVAT
jgi:hypothetical protein